MKAISSSSQLPVQWYRRKGKKREKIGKPTTQAYTCQLMDVGCVIEAKIVYPPLVITA